jgi:hypothetical protein
MPVRRIFLTLTAITGLVTAAAPALAQGPPPPTVAEQPAATLLLPYFEVDLANPAGANTYFAINNASATAVLAHVTIWSAMHVPVHNFNVYLTGYDMQQLNVRDLINGVLPVTASVGQDPADTSQSRRHQQSGPALAGHQLRVLHRVPATVRDAAGDGRSHPRVAHGPAVADDRHVRDEE